MMARKPTSPIHYHNEKITELESYSTKPLITTPNSPLLIWSMSAVGCHFKAKENASTQM